MNLTLLSYGNLLEACDHESLLKNYALQLNQLNEIIGYDMDCKITIDGNHVTSNIAKIILEENFHFKNVTINEVYDSTVIKLDNANINEFQLSDVGMFKNDYFLIGGREDARMNSEYLQVLERYL